MSKDYNPDRPKNFFPLLLLVVLFFAPKLVNGQMFSVDKVKQRSVFSSSSIYLTYAPQTLQIASLATNLRETDFSFEGNVFGINYETESLTFSLGIGSDLGPLQSSLFNVSIALKPYISLINKKRFQLSVPVLLKTDYMRLRTGVTFNNDELVQNIGLFGSGLNLTLRPFAKWRIEGGVIREVGFMTRRQGTSGGRHLGYQIPVRLFGSQLFGKFGLSLLYTYSFGNFDADQGFVDYDFTSSRFGIGVNF